MLLSASKRFLTYSWEALLCEGFVWQEEGFLYTSFLGSPARIDCATGIAYSQNGNNWEKCGFSSGLSIYDYVCDRKSGAKAAHSYCPVGSLPGVFVGGSGLSMEPKKLAQRIEKNKEAFQKACLAMGGKEIKMGDMGYALPVFPDLSVLLKFYFGDADFPPSLTFLWDKSMLQFVRYETVYYIAGALVEKLESQMNSYIQP